MKFKQLKIAAAIIVANLAISGSAAADEVYNFDVPLLTVDSAINAVAQQANAPAIFPYDKVRHLKANPLKGSFTINDALIQLLILKGTDLKAYITDSGVITVWLPETDEKNGVTEHVSDQNVIKTKDDPMKIKGNKGLLSSASAAIIAGTTVTPSLAQDSPSESYDEIIVTATKRSQSIQDIPIAVTAVTPEQLERQGILDIKTLSSVVGGLSIQSSNTQSQGTAIRIRGVGTTGNNIGVESAVGVFVDGVYQSRPGVALGELVDIEQIEVLRGPQGTLFGRNTTAGALVIRSKRPDFNEYNGFASASYGNFNAINLQGALNVPVVDNTLALRVSGGLRKRDGFAISVVDGTDSYEHDRQLIRGQLLWEPSDATSVRLITDYQNTDEDCCNSVVLATTPNFSPALNELAFPQGTPTDGVDRASYAFPASEFSGDVPLTSSGTSFENAIEQWGFSGEVVHDFGGAELTVIGSYRDFFAIGNQDDPIAGNLFQIGPNGTTRPNAPDFFDEIKTYTGEARLQGTAFDDRLDWLAGIYYANEEIQELFPTTLGSDFPAIVSAGATGDPTFLDTVSSVGNGR